MFSSKTRFYWVPDSLVSHMEIYFKREKVFFKYISDWDEESMAEVDEEKLYRYTGPNGEYKDTPYEGYDVIVAADLEKGAFYDVVRRICGMINNPDYQAYSEYKSAWESQNISLQQKQAKETEYWQDYFPSAEYPLSFDEWLSENGGYNGRLYSSFKEFMETGEGAYYRE